MLKLSTVETTCQQTLIRVLVHSASYVLTTYCDGLPTDILYRQFFMLYSDPVCRFVMYEVQVTSLSVCQPNKTVWPL